MFGSLIVKVRRAERAQSTNIGGDGKFLRRCHTAGEKLMAKRAILAEPKAKPQVFRKWKPASMAHL